MFTLKDKKIFITGASRGIGKAITKKLHAAGGIITATATNEEKLKELVTELNNDRISYITCNLSDTKELEDKLTKKLQDIDIIICNAGITKDNIFMRMTDTEWQDVININLNSNFKLIKMVVRGMMKRKYGRIINISSIVATTGNPGQANYCAAKAGLIGLTKSIAQELASRNITANIISPGFIETDMTKNLNEQQSENILKNIPAKKMGTADDIAAATLYLASEEASYITGQTLHINGGLLMP